jgi:predicted Zn-dependent protease
MDRIEKLLDFLRESPADPFLKHALALEYIKRGEEESARRQFIELLAADPDYVGSYYHLGKLQERTGDRAGAAATYSSGLAVARKLNDRHSASELQGALDELGS